MSLQFNARKVSPLRISLFSYLAAIDGRALIAFSLPLVIYILTLSPTIYNLDSAELTTAAVTGGITRATGYPLYLILGNLWSRIPVGDLGYRMNLFSAFFGALTIALTGRILSRWQVNPWAGFGALGLLAVSFTFWALSLIAEVYTLHTALMAAILLLLFRWSDNPTPGNLALIGLTVGISLSNHAATVLLIPACVWYVFTTSPRQALAPKTLLITMGGFLLGLSLYLYLPLRYLSAPAFNYAGGYDSNGVFHPFDLTTWSGLWRVISGSDFSGLMFAYQGQELWAEVLKFGTGLWRAFLGFGIAPGLIGMIVLMRRNWRLGSTLLIMFLGHSAFYISYRVLDKELMFLPAYLIWALWIGVGYQWLLRWVASGSNSPAWIWGVRVVRFAIVIVVVWTTIWNWTLVDLSDDWSARELGETILTQVEPDALILGFWDIVPVIEYLQMVEGQRLDVHAINRFLISPENMHRLILREINLRPVYIDKLTTELSQSVSAKPVGPIYRLISVE